MKINERLKIERKKKIHDNFDFVLLCCEGISIKILRHIFIQSETKSKTVWGHCLKPEYTRVEDHRIRLSNLVPRV